MALYGWVTVHRMDGPHFAHPFTHWGTWGRLRFLESLNTALILSLIFLVPPLPSHAHSQRWCPFTGQSGRQPPCSLLLEVGFPFDA